MKIYESEHAILYRGIDKSVIETHINGETPTKILCIYDTAENFLKEKLNYDSVYLALYETPDSVTYDYIVNRHILLEKEIQLKLVTQSGGNFGKIHNPAFLCSVGFDCVDVVDLETAKYLKSIGYNKPTYYYWLDRDLVCLEKGLKRVKMKARRMNHNRFDEFIYSAPTREQYNQFMKIKINLDCII